MKFNTCLLLFFVAVLTSCNGGKTETALYHTSPNGKVKINIEATRTTGIESWKTEMKVKAYNFEEGKLAFEIYAKDLTNENVTFTWKDDTHCIITFTQQDNTEVKFELIASSVQLHMGAI